MCFAGRLVLVRRVGIKAVTGKLILRVLLFRDSGMSSTVRMRESKATCTAKRTENNSNYASAMILIRTEIKYFLPNARKNQF